MKTKLIHPPIATKATRGTARLWTKNGFFGAGTQPQANKQNWPTSLLADTAADLLQQGYSLRIYSHD